MKFRYSDYSMEQLREELRELKEKAMKAEQLGQVSKVAIYERKIQIVMSYMLNPEEFLAGTVYQLTNDPGHTFKITRINGIMAWGHYINLLGEMSTEEKALPISLLGEVVENE